MMMFAGKLQFLLFSTPKLPFVLHMLSSIAEDGGTVLETLTLNPQIENLVPFPRLFYGNFSHSLPNLWFQNTPYKVNKLKMHNFLQKNLQVDVYISSSQ